jgi:hypothetical protein
MTIWSILRPLEIFYGLLVYFVVIWYILPRFGILYQEKSGNPVDMLYDLSGKDNCHFFNSLKKNPYFVVQICSLKRKAMSGYCSKSLGKKYKPMGLFL